MDGAWVTQAIVEWLGGQLAEAGRRRAVLGVSGGVDSAVAAVLTKRACPQGTLALLLPSGAADAAACERGRRLCQEFDIPWRLVTIGPILELYSQWLPPPQAPVPTRAELKKEDSERAQLALGNLRPRIRMTLLYLYANALDALVVGTSNKSELEVGYFTKYGDGGVDLEPLGGLYKGEVKELARHLGIPEEIVEAVPSAGLWEGQTDEGEMGVTYAQIETYFRAQSRGEKPGLPAGVIARIAQMAASSQHKRQIPPTFDAGHQLIAPTSGGHPPL